MSSKKKKRSVSIDRMSQEQADKIQKELSKKIIEISEKACEEANEFLNVYGFKARMQIDIQPQDIKE